MKTFLKHTVAMVMTATMCWSFFAPNIVLADPVDTGSGQEQTDNSGNGDSSGNDDGGEVVIVDNGDDVKNRGNGDGAKGGDTWVNPYENTEPESVAYNDAYIILYSDGTAVVQKGNTPDTNMGTVVESMSLGYWTYNNHNSSKHLSEYKRIVFKDKVSEVYGCYFFMNLPSLEGVYHLEYMTFKNVRYWNGSVYEMFGGTTPVVPGFEDLNLTGITSLYGLFAYMTADNIDFASGWDTSNIVELQQLFVGSEIADTSGVSNWNTSNVVSMEGMLQATKANMNLNGLSSWDTSKVTNMKSLCASSKAIDLSPIMTWNTAALTLMDNMFSYSSAIVPKTMAWDTSHVTSFARVFQYYNGSSDDLAGIANWDMSSAVNLQYLFYYAANITNIDMTSSWRMPNVNEVRSAFAGCTSLQNLDGAADWGITKIVSLEDICSSDSSLVSIDGLKNWNVSLVKSYASAFSGCSSLETAEVNWDMSACTSMYNMFYDCRALKCFKNEHAAFAMPDLDSTYQMFTNCNALEDISGLAKITDTPKLTGMQRMFNGCYTLPSIDALSNFNVSKVTSFEYLFQGCKSITDVSVLSDWDTSSVTSMYCTFSGCQGVTDFSPIYNWNTSKVKNFLGTFTNTGLSDVSVVSHWDFTAATNVQSMFSHNKNLKVADFTGWDLQNSAITNTYGIDDIITMCSNIQVLVIPSTFKPVRQMAEVYYNDNVVANWIKDDGTEIASINDQMASFTADKAGTYYKLFNCKLYPMGGTLPVGRNISYDIRGREETFATPTWKGHTFKGWFASDGTQYTNIPAGTLIPALYARWEGSQYTLRLDPNKSGVAPVDITMDVDGSYVLKNDVFPSVTDYYIDGWSTEPNGQGEVFANGTAVVPAAEEGSVYTLYPIWVDNVNVNVKFHYILITDGTEVKTVDTKVLCGRTYDYMDPMPTIDYGYQLAYMSYRNDLTIAKYNEDPTASVFHRYESDSTYHVGDAEYKYNSINPEEGQIVDLTGHKFTTADDGMEIYVYLIEPDYLSLYIMPNLKDSMPDLKFVFDGVEYDEGEYKVPVKCYTNHGSSSFEFIQYPSTPNYYYIPYSSSSIPASQYYDGLYHIKEVSEEKGYNFTCPNLELYPDFRAGEENKNQFYYYSDATDGHKVYAPDANIGSWSYSNYYRGETDNYYVPGTTYKIYVGGLWHEQIDFGTALDGYNTNRTNYTVYLGSGYNPNPRATCFTYSLSRPGYQFLGLSTSPLQPGEEGYDASLIFSSSYERLHPVDLVEHPVVYAVWEETSGQQQQVDPTQTYYKLTIHNDGTKRGEWLVRVYGDSFISNYTPIDRPVVHKDGYDKYFYGYYTEPNGQGTKITKDTRMGMADRDIYAYWSTEHSTVYFYPGDTVSNSTFVWNSLWDSMNRDKISYENWFDANTKGFSYTTGAAFTEQMIPYLYTTDDYNFDGWFDTNGNKLEVGTTPADGTIYYAKWSTRATDNLPYQYSYRIQWMNGSTYLQDTSGTIDFAFDIIAPEGMVIPARAVDIVVPFDPSRVFSTQLKVGDFFVYEYRDGNYHVYNPQPLTGEAGFNVNLTVGYSRVTDSIIALPFQLTIDSTPDDGTVEVDVRKTLFYNAGLPNSGDNYTNLNGYGRHEGNGDIVVRWDPQITINDPADVVGIYTKMSPTHDGVIENEGFDFDGKHFDGYGSSDVTIRYPASAFDQEAQSAKISETMTYYVYVAGKEEPYVYTLNANCTVEWVESPLRTNADHYRNMGRAQDYYTYKTNPHIYDIQRQFATLNQTAEFTWWVDYGMFLADKGLGDGTYFEAGIGPGDFYHNSAIYDDYYKWNSKAPRTPLSEDEYEIKVVAVSDYIEWTDAYVNAMITSTGDSKWKKDNIARTVPAELYIRYRGSNEFVLYETNLGVYDDGRVKGGTYGDNRTYNHRFTVWLPEDVVEVKVKSPNEDGMAYHEMDLTYTVDMYPSGALKNKVAIDYKNGVNSVFKSDPYMGLVSDSMNTVWRYSDGSYDYGATTYVWDEDCGLTMFELKSDVTSRSIYAVAKSSDIENNGITQYATFTGGLYVNGSFDGDYVPLNDGIIYILLPKDTTIMSKPYLATVETYNGRYWQDGWYHMTYTYGIDEQYYDITYTHNWNNTGRTLLTAEYHGVPDDVEKNGVVVIFSYGKSIVDLRYNNVSTEAEFDVLGIDKSNNGAEYSGRSVDLAGVYQGSVYARLKSLADPNFKESTAVAYLDQYFDAESITQYGFSEYIANSSGIYNNSATVVPGEDYYYRYVYSHNAAGDRVSDLKITTTLDGYGLWRGISATTLTAITSDNRTITVDPIIWYNTTANPDFSVIDAAHGWTTTEPAQTDTVYGLVIDYSHDADNNEAIITGASPILVTVHQQMNAPVGTTFESNGRSHVNVLPDNKSLDTTATVTGEVIAPDLTVSIDAVPAGGPADKPTKVDPLTPIAYEMIVRNPGEHMYRNVVVENQFPTELTFTLDDVVVGYKEKPITSYEGISNVSLNSNKLTFTIDTFDPYDSYDIKIKTTAGETSAVINDTAYIVGYNGIDIHDSPISSDTIYHEIVAEKVPDPTGVRGQIAAIAGFGALAVVGLGVFLFWAKKSKKKKDEGENIE